MKRDIRNVNDVNGLIEYFVSALNWKIDLDYFEDIEDITYDFDAEDIGLKEEAFAKIKTLRQLRPLVDGQKWGIFCVEFDSQKFEITALRKILSGLIPTRRNSAEHAVWDQQDLLFICFWGEGVNRTIGIAHFEDKESGLPQIKMIYCAPAVEDFTQIRVFEDRMKSLKWPEEYVDHERWQAEWSSAFKTAYRQTINDVSTLTEQLAVEAQGIRDRILSILDVETRNGYVHLLYEKFRNTLIHDMTETQFADMYAQTVVYGLFSARCMDETQENFSAAEAVECIPNTNPFLKNLMKECLGSQNSKLSFDELEIGNVVELLLHTKTDAIIQDFNRQTGGGREDPVIHFYEEFLEAYDKTQKVQRGVYYTPQPVVNFIVRAVDSIIKTEFGFEDGLATTETKKLTYYRDSKKRKDGRYTKVQDTKDVPAIQVLDPSTGTGTFIRQSILQIYENFKEKNKGLNEADLKSAWNDYVPRYLLPRLNAFELMMAPYAVAHMKLAMVLKDTGYDFDSDARLNVYLTNTLEEPGNSDMQMTMFDDPLASESIAANVVKKNEGVNVIIGNPPYSGISSNSGEWITRLIEDYKYINGVHFGERKHWLQDDYVKFIRFSEASLEDREYGVLAFINNHAFIDNPTFRCMRWHLLKTFDKIYILDLHGSTKKREVSPDGKKDENVFDIQQGVSINIFVKEGRNRGDSFGEVYHTDLYGSRDLKYDWLLQKNFDDIEWKKIDYSDPYYFYIERDETNRASWENGWSIKDIMPYNSTGILTARDSLVVDMDRDVLVERINTFVDPSKTDEEIRTLFYGNKKAGKYLPGDTRGWSLSDARKKIGNFDHNSMVQTVTYRPFDDRFIYYCPEMVDWGRFDLMKTIIDRKNLALVVTRQSIAEDWANAFVSVNIVDDSMVSNRTKERGYVFPLYLEHGLPNIEPQFIKEMSVATGLDFSEEGSDDSFSAKDVLTYIYAILYSKKYRSMYCDQLKADFPHIPIPFGREMFRVMKQQGDELIKAHLLMIQDDEAHPENYIGVAQPVVNKPHFEQRKIYLNKNDFFENVDEELWEFIIGAYQPLQKWLKDRKGKNLKKEDLVHYSKMIQAIRKTKEVMCSIDLVME